MKTRHRTNYFFLNLKYADNIETELGDRCGVDGLRHTIVRRTIVRGI